MMKKINKKGDLAFGELGLGGWIIAIAFLVLMLLLIFILKDKGSAILESLKNLFKFGV